MKEVIRIFILCIIIQFTLANNEIYTSLFGLEVTQSQIDSDPAYSCSVPNDCIYAPGRLIQQFHTNSKIKSTQLYITIDHIV